MGQSLAQRAFRTSYHQTVAVAPLVAVLSFGLYRINQVHQLYFEEVLDFPKFHDPTKVAG